MRRRALAALALLLIAGAAPASGHSFYAALTRINYNAHAGTIEVIHRLITHDMEAVLSVAAGERLTFDGATFARAEHEAGAYLASHFALAADGTALSLRFIGVEARGDDLYAYFEAPLRAPPRRLAVRDRIFTDELPAQRNLVVVTVGEATVSARFERGAETRTLDLES